MNKIVSAKLNQGIDSFLRVTLLLRRKEIDIKEISMTTDYTEQSGMEILLDESKINIDVVLNYMSKLHDVMEVRVQ